MERRWSLRKNLQLDVNLEAPLAGKSVEASLHDISVGGAFIETQALLATPLIMAFKLSGTHPQNNFRLYARVVRRTQTGVGVAFLPMQTDVIGPFSKALFQYEQQPGIRH